MSNVLNTFSIITLAVPTQFGITLKQTKLIEHFEMYSSILKQNSKEYNIQLTDDYNIYFSTDIFGNITIEKNLEKIKAFNSLYSKGVTTNSEVDVFETMEKEYMKQNGHSIYNSELFVKYNHLVSKLKIIEKQLLSIKTKHPPITRVKQTIFNSIEQMLSESYLSFVEILSTNQQTCDKICTERIQSILKHIDEYVQYYNTDEKISIRKNKYGYYIFDKHNYVYDSELKKVTGVFVEKNFVPIVEKLSEHDVKVCKYMGVETV